MIPAHPDLRIKTSLGGLRRAVSRHLSTTANRASAYLNCTSMLEAVFAYNIDELVCQYTEQQQKIRVPSVHNRLRGSAGTVATLQPGVLTPLRQEMVNAHK